MLKLGFQLTTNLNSLPIPVGSFHVYRSAIDSFWCAILSYEQGGSRVLKYDYAPKYTFVLVILFIEIQKNIEINKKQYF